MRGLTVLLMGALLAGAAIASAPAVKKGQVWRYTDSEGVTRYTNVKPGPGVQSSALLFDYIETQGSAWVQISSGDKFKVYFHGGSVKQSGRLRKGWIMFDNEEKVAERWGSTGSTIERWSVDCEEETYAQTDFLAYENPSGTGKVIYSWSGEGKTQPVVPGTIGVSVLEAICTAEVKPRKPKPAPPTNGQG